MADVRIEVTCPGCEKPFLIAANEQGHVADCPHCQGWVDVPEVSRSPTTAEIDDARNVRNMQEYDRQLAEGDRQLSQGAKHLIEYAKHIEQWQRALDHRDQQDARFDKLLDRVEAIIGRWEKITEVFARGVEQMNSGSKSS